MKKTREERIEDVVRVFFKDDSKRVEILKDKLETLIRSSIQPKKNMSYSKARKYYDQFLSVYHREEKLKSETVSIPSQLKLAMFKSYLAYDDKRGNVIPVFKEFLITLIDEVLKENKKTDLELAKTLFECFMGYAKSYFSK